MLCGAERITYLDVNAVMLIVNGHDIVRVLSSYQGIVHFLKKARNFAWIYFRTY